MFDTPAELLQQIRLGEDSFLELKIVQSKSSQGRPQRVTDEFGGLYRNSLADEIAAFANSHGGVLVLGVDDKTKEVLGIPLSLLDQAETFVREILNDHLTPPLPAAIRKMELPDSLGTLKPIVRVDIPRSLFVHKSPGGYFNRVGSSKREMKPEQLARLFQQRSQARIIRFDEQAVPGTSIHDLNLERVTSALSAPMAEPEFLQKLGILTKDDEGMARCSVGGLLAFGRQPQQHLRNAFIEAVQYRGEEMDSNYQVKSLSCDGTLDQQIEKAFAFVVENMRKDTAKAPQRIEHHQFDERAVFEAIVNAVAHRDYAIHGSKIRLFLFSNRLEIYSPGELPNSVTLETMEQRQSTRNELIVHFLSKLSSAAPENAGRKFYMEARGEGVPLIIKRTVENASQRPDFALIGEELKLTLPGRSAPAT